MSESTASPEVVPERSVGRLQVTFVPGNVWRTGLVRARASWPSVSS